MSEDGLTYAGVGWALWRNKSFLPDEVLPCVLADFGTQVCVPWTPRAMLHDESLPQLIHV